VSQDNENKENKPADDLDFNFSLEEENNEGNINEILSDDPFNSAFSEEEGTLESLQPLQNETETPEETLENDNFSFPPFDENLGEIPSTFMAENLGETNLGETTASEEITFDKTPEETNSEEINAAEINVDTDKKTSGKKNRKDRKENKVTPEKNKKEGEPLGLGAGLSLTLSGLLLFGLIAFNVFLLVFQPYKEIGVGFSSTIYYLVGFDFVAGLGIVAVPFMFYKYRKENDLFQTMLGISVMALSFAVLLLMTEFLRYDYTQKPASALPTITPVVLSNAVPSE
jgi:hypothetical protein